MKHKIKIAFVTVVLFSFISCEKIPKTPINEEEVINTIILSLQKNGTTTIQNFVFNDPDGDGALNPIVDSIIIEKAALYNATITLLNTTIFPADTISKEVFEEGIDHQFFYQSTPNTILSSFVYNDADINENPIGLNFGFNTSNIVGSGNLKITLRHQPNKTAIGVSSGDITNANGETDLEVDFPIRLF